MNVQSQQFLLDLARKSIAHYFATGNMLRMLAKQILLNELKQPRGSFVTLMKHGELRGCIGHIEPTQELYKDVIENAVSAAFDDPRFSPLQIYELNDIQIEISVLSTPTEVAYFSIEELLTRLQPGIDGVIISKGNKGATYLPQVWEDFDTKEDFLTSLCLKAGLRKDEWMKGKLKVETYQTEVFGEDT
ncbi:MAG: AmmeMemoRadiSam system protein A [Candidatus Magasanikbacteria bacterium]|jgi:AmmeMemoRadiSam system protein A